MCALKVEKFYKAQVACLSLVAFFFSPWFILVHLVQLCFYCACYIGILKTFSPTFFLSLQYHLT